MSDVSAIALAAYQRGDITWKDVHAIERAHQPLCKCGQPTNALIVSGPICVDCLRALYALTTDGHLKVKRGEL
jgi:hypothetical protein